MMRKIEEIFRENAMDIFYHWFSCEHNPNSFLEKDVVLLKGKFKKVGPRIAISQKISWNDNCNKKKL